MIKTELERKRKCSRSKTERESGTVEGKRWDNLSQLPCISVLMSVGESWSIFVLSRSSESWNLSRKTV